MEQYSWRTVRSGTRNRVVTNMVFMGNFPMSFQVKFNKFVEIKLSMCVCHEGIQGE